MPELALGYHLEMLPQLEAQETSRLIKVLSYVAGRMDEEEARTYIDELNRALPRAPRASVEQLRAMGIEVVREGG